MERYLKKLVLDAQAMSFWDSEKGGWEPVGPSGRKTVLGGLDWGKRMYTGNRRRAIKLIPVRLRGGFLQPPPSAFVSGEPLPSKLRKEVRSGVSRCGN